MPPSRGEREWNMPKSWFALIFAAVLAAAGGLPAAAHGIRVFATAEGTTINGTVYVAGGGRAKAATVTVFGPGREPLGEVVTDRDGSFSFAAKQRVDHRLVVDLGDGHRAEFIVKADELAENLPGGGPAKLVRAPGVRAGTPERPKKVTSKPLEELIERAVARQVRPLREQLDASENRIRLRDIIGGLGYILGITGIAFFFLARRRGTGANQGSGDNR